MTCTKEEIERKRIAALQKKRARVSNINTQAQNVTIKQVTTNYPQLSPNNGPIKLQMKKTNIFHPYSKTSKDYLQENSVVPVTKVVSGTTYLVSENRFEVNPSEFCTPLIDIFKSIPSKSYDNKSNLWSFSVDHYDMLMSKVAPLAPYVVLGPLPSYVLKVLKQKTMDPNFLDLSPIELTLREKLMSFQEEGVRFGIAHRGRCMIADDMGLGKTFQALAIASYYRHNWPLLIVTTSSMRETWQSKLIELLPSVSLSNIVTLTTTKDVNHVRDRQSEVVIVSYKMTAIHTDLLKSKKFGVVIIDESHYLKSHKARCTLALGAIARQAARIVLLSGTPALSRPAELYTQLALIEPKLFTSYMEYGKRYCAGKQTAFGWDMSGQSNLAELQTVLQKRFLIRRTKEQVLDTLEEKTRESVLLDESLLAFDAAEPSAARRARAGAGAGAAAGGSPRSGELVTYFGESARVKIPAIRKYIGQIAAEPGGKFLVFAHHRAVLEAVSEALDAADAPHVCIAGCTPPALRAELVERFQSDASCRAGVLSLTAAGAGLTLTAADLVVFAELHWNPGVLLQAESRAHRLGRRGAVRVRYLLARGTSDDCVWPLLRDKLAVLNDVGLSTDTLENASLKHQESNNKITQYLSPGREHKNKNDYIPGTNIRKCVDNKQSTSLTMNVTTHSGLTNDMSELGTLDNFFLDDEDIFANREGSRDRENVQDVDKLFLADEEGDELLANLDF